MSDEQDSFMLNAFGLDLGRAAQGIIDDPVATIGQAASGVVQVVQGGQGTAVPDARGDAGGRQASAPAGGAKPAPRSAAPPPAQGGNESEGLLGQFQERATGLEQGVESSIQSSLQSAQDSVLTGLGASPDTVEGIRAAEQAVADFDRGRQAGRASGSIGLLEMLPPVQLAKAGIRIADADDGEAEALKIAEEKAGTLAAIGQFAVDPAGSGSAIGENLGKSAVKAKQEGRLAEFAGNLVGQGDVIAATVAVGGAGAGIEAGGARGVAAGVEAGGAEGVAAGVEAGGARGVAAGVEAGGAESAAAGVESPLAQSVAGGGGATAEGGAVAAEGGAGPRTLPGLGEPVPPGEPGIPPTEPVDPFGKTQPEGAAKGPPTEVDPVNPEPEPEVPKANAAETPAQIRQNLIDATAEQKAAEQASNKATKDFVRFRQNKPNPARGFEGDPSKFDPVVDEALEDQMLRAQRTNAEAINKLKAAQQAARDAAGRAKGARGGGGFPPPR